MVTYMERLTSRQNRIISHVRRLGADRAYRRDCGEYVCDGVKLLCEALSWDADISAVFWSREAQAELDKGIPQYSVPRELLEYITPLKNSPGPVFTVKMKSWDMAPPGRCLVAETIQDPGNLGTILRTANALNMDTVIFTGDCADIYNPKTVRAAMGALFRQRFFELDRAELRRYLDSHGYMLYGAALSDKSRDIRRASLEKTAVAVGSEGKGLSPELLEVCDGELIIPMNSACESLNAAVAAAIIMWELSK